MALFGTVSSVGTLGPVRFAWALIALLASARQQRPLLPHEDLPHTHKPRDFTTRDDVEKKHRAPEPRSSPTLKLRLQRATPSAPKAILPRPLRTSGTSWECDLLLAQPFPLMYGTASNPWTSRNGQQGQRVGVHLRLGRRRHGGDRLGRRRGDVGGIWRSWRGWRRVRLGRHGVGGCGVGDGGSGVGRRGYGSEVGEAARPPEGPPS